MRYSRTAIFCIITDAIASITGDDPADIFPDIMHEPYQVNERDYREIIQHIEAVFDCTLDMLHHYSGAVDGKKITATLEQILPN